MAVDCVVVVGSVGRKMAGHPSPPQMTRKDVILQEKDIFFNPQDPGQTRRKEGQR